MTFGVTLAQDEAPAKEKYGLPSPKHYDRWSVGLSFGQTVFFSDIRNDEESQSAFKGMEFAPNFGLNLTYNVSHSVGLRFSGSYAQLKSGPSAVRFSTKDLGLTTKEGTIKPVVKFEGSTVDLAFEGVYTFGNISHLKRNKKFHFFVSAGAGLSLVSGGELSTDESVTFSNTDSVPPINVVVPSGTVLGDDVGPEESTQFVIPIGVGFKYQLGKVDLGMSFDYRYTFDDSFDGINKYETRYDQYAMIRLNGNYTLGSKKSMEWTNPMEVVYSDIADLKEKVDLLSGDKDKDGVADIFDKDNSTPEGTKVYGDGTSVDTDGDGVPDNQDGDPFSMKGAQVDANGIEIDTDGDGVADGRDLEPNTPKGQLVNFQGQSIVSKEDGAKGGVFLPSVYFDLNSSSIKRAQRERLVTVAQAMKANPDIKITVTGHTDNSGSEDYNTKLGQRRADAVKDHLVDTYGISADRITAESKGLSAPLANDKNKSLNRRVDFSLVK
jgi:outer membrane protein OmpA-like peptidoglycan-associated protein